MDQPDYILVIKGKPEGPFINGKNQRVGGYWTCDEKLVTFWD